MKKLARCMALLIIMSCFLTTSGWGYSFSEEHLKARGGNALLTSLTNPPMNMSGKVRFSAEREWLTTAQVEFYAGTANFSSVEDAIWWTTYHQLPLVSQGHLSKNKTMEGYQFITDNYKLVTWVDRITPIPEPTTITLISLGITGIFTVSNRKKK